MKIPKEFQGKKKEIEDGSVIVKSEKYDIIIQAIDGGVSQILNIKDAKEGDKYIFPIELKKGHKLKLNNDGTVSVLDKKGKIYMGILPAWAKDANGKNLKSWYTLEDNYLVQNIDFREATFPIIADPTYCSQYTNSVWSENRAGYDTVRIKPTSCARAFGRWDWSGSFNEVIRKSRRNFSGNNYESLFWQWGCHLYYAFPDSTWDLEVNRPNVGYWRTVGALCNPS